MIYFLTINELTANCSCSEWVCHKYSCMNRKLPEVDTWSMITKLFISGVHFWRLWLLLVFRNTLEFYCLLFKYSSRPFFLYNVQSRHHQLVLIAWSSLTDFSSLNPAQSLKASILACTECLHRVNVHKFLLISPNWCVYLKESKRESYLWIFPYVTNNALYFLFILVGWSPLLHTMAPFAIRMCV